jgi:hypothetical protein
MSARSDIEGVRYLVGQGGGAQGQARAHVESYFVKANHPTEGRAIWVKTTIFSPTAGSGGAHGAVGEAWAIAFDRDRGHVAVKACEPIADCRFSREGIDAQVAGCSITRTLTSGALRTSDRSLSWRLELAPERGDLRPLPYDWMYNAPFPSSKLASPVGDARVYGTITVNGETWDVENWRGMLGHNWGKRHAPEYAWVHANQFVDENGKPVDLVFEGVSARVALGTLRTPRLTTLMLRVRGVTYAINSVRSMLTTRASISHRRWTFSGTSRGCTIEGEFWADTSDFVGLFYANPSGPATHCLNSKIAYGQLTVTLAGRAPFKVTTDRAALEVGTLDEDHGIRMYV